MSTATLATPACEVELESIDCLHCGGSSHRTLMTAPDMGERLPGEFSIVECADCGLAFTNPRPTAETISYYYPSHYMCHDVDGNWDTRWRARLRDRLERSVLRTFYNHPPRANLWTQLEALAGQFWIRRAHRRVNWIPFTGQGRLLDFGCGSAAFTRRMKHAGWDVEGLDVSPAAAAKVERETGIRVHVGTLPHDDLIPRSFDAITMWAALEHVHDPRAVIGAARELLAPGGIFVASVPNFGSWSAKNFGQYWQGLELPRHLTHFTPDSLRAMVAAEGLCVRRVVQIARDGWMRISARRVQADGGSPWLSLLRHKWAVQPVATWTQWTRQADDIAIVAERI